MPLELSSSSGSSAYKSLLKRKGSVIDTVYVLESISSIVSFVLYHSDNDFLI